MFQGDVKFCEKKHQTFWPIFWAENFRQKQKVEKRWMRDHEQLLRGTPGYTLSWRSAYESKSTEIIRKFTRFQKFLAEETMLAEFFWPN